MKTDPKMRDLADLTNRAEAPDRARSEIEAAAAAARPLDPYGAHEMQIGPTRVFDPKKRSFVMKPAAACSCGRLGDAVSTEYEAILAVRVHALEIVVHRLARAAGIDLDTVAGPLERAKGGDPTAIAALEARDEIMADAVARTQGSTTGPAVTIPAAADLATDDDARARIDELDTDEARTFDTDPLEGDHAEGVIYDRESGYDGPIAQPDEIGPGSFEGTWQGIGTDDDQPRPEGCVCTSEPGDSPCAVHGDSDDEDANLARCEFVERCTALGLDYGALLDEADELSETSDLELAAARERVLADAIRNLGPRIGEPGKPLPTIPNDHPSTGDDELEDDRLADRNGIVRELEAECAVCARPFGEHASTDDRCPGEGKPTAFSPMPTIPVDELADGSLWVCKNCEHRNELDARTCASCSTVIPESPDYAMPLDEAAALAMLGPNHPIARAAKGHRDTDPDRRDPAWDKEQIVATGGTLPDEDA